MKILPADVVLTILIGFAYAWGPVCWVVCAEMFPMRERGKATSLTTFCNWLMTTVVGAVFPIASSHSLTGCFGFFAGVVFVAVLVSFLIEVCQSAGSVHWFLLIFFCYSIKFVYFYIPETANRTAPEIDEEYIHHKPALPRKKWI